MDELKLCPFCERTPDTMKYTMPFGAGKSDKIARCPGCGAFLNAVKWQKRPIEDALRAEVARLTAALEWYAEPGNYPHSADERKHQSDILFGITDRARRALGRE